MSLLILTSPHSKCPEDTERKCDLVAGLSSKIFNEICIKKGIPCIYLPGDDYRHNHDLNRQNSRKTNYRINLNNILKMNSPEKSLVNALVLDIHSFPNYRIEAAGDNNLFKKGEIPPDIVFLKGPKDQYKFNGKVINLCDTLYKKLNKDFTNKINCKIREHLTVLDILNNASEYEIPGVLIEINEKYLENPNLLSIIVNSILEIFTPLDI